MPAQGIDAPPIKQFLATRSMGPHSVLFIDYDGTLAPFVEDRDKAVPYDGVRSRLERLCRSDDTRVVVVSGRGVEDVNRLLGLETPVEIWGNHGLQRFRPAADQIETFDLPGDAHDAIESARERADDLGLDSRVEHKPASVAVHTRGLDDRKAEELLQEVRGEWEPLIEECDDVELHAFDGGLEFRSSAIDKGFAIRSILSEMPTDAPVAYLGDDLTDEDAFEELATRGLKILVRDECRRTAADVWLTPPEELLQFLDAWAAAPHNHEDRGKS